MTEQRTYGGSPAQRWNVTNLGNGYYSIINMASGRSLDVWELSPGLGASIAPWAYWAHDGPQRTLERVGTGYFRIRSRLRGHVLHIASLSAANGARVIQWSVTGNTNQHFRFVAP